jgi:hypothetical protein
VYGAVEPEYAEVRRDPRIRALMARPRSQ